MTWFRETAGWTVVSELQDSLQLTCELTLPLFLYCLAEAGVNPGKLRTNALRFVRMHSVLHQGAACKSLDADNCPRGGRV